MLKFFVLGVLLWEQGVTGVSGQPTVPASELDKNDNNGTEENGSSPSRLNSLGPLSVIRSSRPLPDGYLVTPGIGAHKVNTRVLSWNAARKICMNEGGHLAIIRSTSEEMIILQAMMGNNIGDAWLGYHDIFEEGSWMTVLDEPMERAGWSRWSKLFSPNPDNARGNQNCGRIIRNGGGLDDEFCYLQKPFVCKI